MKEIDTCLPCGKRGKEFLHDVGSGEFGLDVFERILLDIINSKLSACQH